MNQAVAIDADGEWVWVLRMSSAQEAAWIKSAHQQRDAALSCAKRLSKLAVDYARGASTDTNPVRAGRWATEALRLRREAREYLAMARRNNI